MLHVGLTGGLASGKSVVGRELERLGCRLIRMDDLGHQVLAPDGEAYQAVVAEFGPSILDRSQPPVHPPNYPAGYPPPYPIDRRALGRIVFQNPERLAKLNSLVHPPIFARQKAIAEEFRRQQPHGILVTEAAILIETGSYKKYDRLIVAVCRPEQQLERAVARDKMTREEALDRIRRQMPIEEKKSYADFLIDTSGSEASTLEQTRAVFEKLRSLEA